MAKLTPKGKELAIAQAMLLGFECWPDPTSSYGVRWNSGTQFGQWARDRNSAAVTFLSAKGYFVDIDGGLHRI